MEAKFDRATPVLGPTELGKPNNRELLVEDLTEIPELWRRSADGAGIERTFKFKSFQAAWVGPLNLMILLLVYICLSDTRAKKKKKEKRKKKEPLHTRSIRPSPHCMERAKARMTELTVAQKFMNDVAAEAKRLRHHPEWSNIYNTVFIRWSTHDIGGLSSQDTQLARICDELASPTLTESTERSEQTRTLDDLCGLVEKVG